MKHSNHHANSKQPSIFTPRHQRIPSPPTNPPRPPAARTPRTSSPFRRQSTPGNHQPNAVAIAAAEAQPDDHWQAAAIGRGSLSNTLGSIVPPAPSIWASILPESRNGSPKEGHKGRASSLQASPTPHLLNTPPNEFPPPYQPTTAGRKRGVDTAFAAPTSEPTPKRQRIKQRFTYNLDGSTFPKPNGFVPALEPPSPLFFSSSPREQRPRPRLPPRFSSAEAAARMLSKARAEDSHIKTVTLARGTIATASSFGTPGMGASPINSSQGASRKSLDRSSTGRSNSPEALSSGGRDIGSNASHHLNSIGILELLEQDERPTFIVDLADATNYGEGKLSPLFANSSVRSYDGLYDLITGTASESTSPGFQTYIEFKSWLLSASVNGESLNVCLPAFSYANMMWTCSTLRKRLRIISGAFQSTASSGQQTRQRSSSRSAGTLTNASAPREQMDYFGSAAPPRQPSVSADASLLPGEAVQSIESAATVPKHSNSDSIANGAVLTPGAMEPADSTDLLPSPITYVQRSEPPLLTADTPVTNINWFSSHVPVASVADLPCFDWTRLPITDDMPSHIQFARSVDWASTALGPIESWSPDLRQMCNLIMASPHPAAMYWGEELIAIYNEAYILLAGQKHPDLMGQSYRVAWSEIWSAVKDVFANAMLTGESTLKDDDGLFIRRSDYLEETYFSWSIIPMVGGDGRVMGLYNPAFEKTRRKIAERRMLTLREIGERTASARDVKGFWTQVQSAFDYNEIDSPFLLLYSVVDDSDSDSSSVYSTSALGTRQCLLEGALGVPEGHACAPEQIDLRNGMEGFGPVFREVMKSDKVALLEVGSKELPKHLLQGLDWRGFGDPCTSVVICPIHPTTEKENVLGFLVLGVNPRRPYDDDYSLFVQLLSRQLATSLAAVVLFEEEIRRGQKAAKLAALDRIELSEQLAQRTQEAKESETKFTRMAEFAPVGMFIAGPDGKIIFANDHWYAITRVPRRQDAADKWIDVVKPEDREMVISMWNTLVFEAKSVSNEFRFKAQWQDGSGDRGDTWVLFSAYPEKYDDGKLKSVFGSITNISQQKWAEDVQRRRVEEAVELKRQQENFIDITSHEMRNPLSAILQCSDEISTSMTEFRNSNKKEIPEDLIANILDAAQTVSLCSQHQKRIVDDILTLSKLDSALLLVTPVDAQPLTVVQRALKMHEGELQAADIQMKFIVDQSFRDMQLDWVRFDPSRVLQVLINLTTNAIKFTTTEKKRTITVTISASTQKPSEQKNAPVNYFATRSRKEDAMEDLDWGDGEKVYIHFSVRDTGRGLSPEEKKMLFLRFSQASPRTHVQYGGSGLGLFISRELTELQGGEIGVESEAGKGSTFAFYVAARRTTAPVEDDGAGVSRRGPSDAKGKKEPLASASKDGKIGDTTAAGSREVAPKPSPASLQKKVLIVEDNLVNQRVLQKQLKNLGTEVHLANHGGEALEKLLQSTYVDGGALELGVVLMDQEMPVMDGLTCTRRIREMEREGKFMVHVPIIAVTANARQEQIKTALEAGMDDVVSKPFQIKDLTPRIQELMLKYPMPRSPQDSAATTTTTASTS